MKRLILVVLSLVAGCGGQEDGPGTGAEMFGDGSRLVAIWDQAPGSPRRQSGWYDTELATPCTFYPVYSRDGISRCLPWPSSGQRSFNRFADAACTVPIAPAPAQSRWFWVGEWNGCDLDIAALYELAETADPSSVYGLESGSCAPAADSMGLPWRHIGRVIPGRTLVAAPAPSLHGTGRITSYLREASDGSWSFAGQGRDTLLGADVQASAGTGRWYPISDLSIYPSAPSAFADSTCNVDVAFGGGCTQSRYINHDPPFPFVPSVYACGVATIPSQFRRAGAPLDRTQVHSRVAGECLPVSQNDAPMFFAVGEPVPDAEFAEISRALIGSGRVKLRTVAGPDGPAVTTDAYFDTHYQVACVADRAADGVSRCLPARPAALRYADAACSIRAIEVVDGCELPGLVSAKFFGGDDVHVFSVEPGVLVAVFDRDGDGPCVAASKTAGRSYYRLGPELPPSELVEMTLSSPR